MPGFQKDYAAFPDSNGNQWARPGGLFGRNRVASKPTAAKQGPAINKPGQTSGINFTAPTSQVQSSNQAYTSNPFVNKLSSAIYMPGQGPVTSQVQPAQKMVPSPNFPQPDQQDQKGKFPPGGQKAAVAAILRYTEAGARF